MSGFDFDLDIINFLTTNKLTEAVIDEHEMYRKSQRHRQQPMPIVPPCSPKHCYESGRLKQNNVEEFPSHHLQGLID